jgi:hypothetical protein
LSQTRMFCFNFVSLSPLSCVVNVRVIVSNLSFIMTIVLIWMM